MAYKDIQQYSELVHEASTYGGAEAFRKAIKEEAIKTIERSRYSAGYADGQSNGLLKGISIGGLIVSTIVGSIYVGKKIWDNHKAKIEENKKLEEDAEKAQKVLLDEEKPTEAKEVQL